MKQEHVRSNLEGGSCEDGMKTARSFKLCHPPNWTGPALRMAELVACSVQLGGWPGWSCVRSSSACPARPSVELDWSSSADGRACRVFDQARRTGLVQLGGWPSWWRVRSSSANRRTGLIQLGGWLSWSGGRSSSAIQFSSADCGAGRFGRSSSAICRAGRFGRSSSAICRAGRCALSTLQ